MKRILICVGFIVVVGLIGLYFYFSNFSFLQIKPAILDLTYSISNIKVPSVYIVESGSMEPAIKTGSIVFSVKSKVYDTNDVITFKNASGTTVTHRIVNKYIFKNEYVTKGDANKSDDQGRISGKDIIGKVNYTVPYVGYFANFAKTPKGFILLVIIPATLIIYEEFKSLKKELARLFAKLRDSRLPTAPETDKPFPKAWVFVPVIACLSILAIVTTAFFTDGEKSASNILGASGSYGEKTANLFESNDYTCANGATNLTDPQEKIAILKKKDGNIVATVQLIGATSNSSYDIWLNQDPGGCPLGSPTSAGAITTDGSGNGIGVATSPYVPGATKFWISAVGGGQVLRSISVDL